MEAYEISLRKIYFIRDTLIPKELLIEAEEILKDIDIDDTVFLALANFLSAKIWTGDKKLIDGLTKKGIRSTIITEELYKKFLEFELKRIK